MDLAKIRKKSLQTPGGTGSEHFTPPETPLEPIKKIETVPAAPVSSDVDCFQEVSSLKTVAPVATAARFGADVPPEFDTPVRSPLESILAGRSAAGCDDESILADDVTGEIITELCLEYLCFRVSNEIYGINIMDIKEIIKPREVTEVPRAPLFVSGVLSLRGTIIPVIDMRIRLGLALKEPTGKERIVVIKSNNSFSGLLVDEVTQVVQVQQDDVEATPTVLDGIDRDFVSGLGRSGGQLIILLNLENIADINLC